MHTHQLQLACQRLLPVSLDLLQLQKKETLLHHQWDDPTEEEHEEDLREDERCARWEAQAVSQFVPPRMIVRPFSRRRPVVVCLSRDVPATAKRDIVNQLEHDLPGLAVHFDNDDHMGLRVDDLQQALSARYGPAIIRFVCAH